MLENLSRLLRLQMNQDQGYCLRMFRSSKISHNLGIDIMQSFNNGIVIG